jgi:hypothetical protein
VSFKTHATFQDFSRFVHFMKWADFCEGRSLPLNAWNEFVLYCGQNPIGEGLEAANWATWRSWNDWTEYQYFIRWYSWESQSLPWTKLGGGGCQPCGAGGACSVANPCPGSCARKKLDKLEAKCFHTYSGCGNCYTSPTPVIQNKEQYPYQFGVQRCCCCYDIASFLDLVEVQRREACDPLCDFVNLGVGIDPCASQINWYINKRKVLSHIGIGLRMSEQFRVRENGGYAEEINVRRVLVDFGTGSLLDASLPNNYDRVRAQTDYIDMTNLVPVQDNLSDPNSKTNYYQIYHNKLGGLLPVNRPETFAVVSDSPAYRLFGQGAILRLQNLQVITRRTFNDYRIPRTCCKPQCGSCNDKPGYCLDGDSDCEDEPACCEPDARLFSVETQPGTAGSNSLVAINQLGYPLGSTSNPAGFGARDIVGNGGITPYILANVPASKQFWSPQCVPSNGVNPYDQ